MCISLKYTHFHSFKKDKTFFDRYHCWYRNVTLGSPTHICKNMNYRRDYRTDNVLPGQGYHTYLLVQWHKSLTVEWQLAWDNHSLWAEIWTQDLQNTENWSAIIQWDNMWNQILKYDMTCTYRWVHACASVCVCNEHSLNWNIWQ